MSLSYGRRKLGNPRGNLHISVGDGVPSNTVWGHLTLSCPGTGRAVVKTGHSNLWPGSKKLFIFKKQTLKSTNLKNSSDCFGNLTPGQCSHHFATEMSLKWHITIVLHLMAGPRYISFMFMKVIYKRLEATECLKFIDIFYQNGIPMYIHCHLLWCMNGSHDAW